MVCLDNSYYYYDFVVIVNLFAFFGVFLPNFGRLASLLYGLNFGVLSVAVLQAVFPAAVPDNQLAYVSLNVTAFSLFALLGSAAGSVALVFGTLLLLGPLAISGREHLHHWFEAQLHLQVSDTVLIILVSAIWLALTLAYSAAERVQLVQIVCLSLLYSLLAVFGAKVLVIELLLQKDAEEPRLLCCGKGYPNKTCPFVLDLWLGIALGLAILLRLYLAKRWHSRRRRSNRKSRQDDENTVASDSHLDAEDARELDPEAQSLLGAPQTAESLARSSDLVASSDHRSIDRPQARRSSSRFVSRYLPANRWR